MPSICEPWPGAPLECFWRASLAPPAARSATFTSAQRSRALLCGARRAVLPFWPPLIQDEWHDRQSLPAPAGLRHRRAAAVHLAGAADGDLPAARAALRAASAQAPAEGRPDRPRLLFP